MPSRPVQHRLDSVSNRESMGATDLSRDSGPLVEFQNVSVSYEKSEGSATLAVDDVNFSIAEGGFVALIGPSGCGKTTILNTIAGFVRPTSGRVLVGGVPVTRPGADRAVVHQQTGALLPWLNVEDNIGIGLKVRRMRAGDRKEIVDRYLDVVGLSDFRRHAIYELSGGMQQRVALARALATESRIVLLDEPLGALDALQRQIMQDFMLEVWYKTARTFLLITHSVEEAVYTSTEVFVMAPRPGRIIARSEVSFGRRALEGMGARVKTAPEFVETQAEMLAMLTPAGHGADGARPPAGH